MKKVYLLTLAVAFAFASCGGAATEGNEAAAPAGTETHEAHDDHGHEHGEDHDHDHAATTEETAMDSTTMEADTNMVADSTSVDTAAAE